MKKVILLLGLLIFFGSTTYAKHVDENTAKKVGQHFLTSQTNSETFKSSSALQLIYKAVNTNNNLKNLNQQTTFFYIFNSNSQGFIIVAGDDNVTPILGYSNEGAFDPNNIPPNVRKWLEEYKNQIRYVVENNISATEEIKKEWANYIYDSDQNSAKSTLIVTPLIQTKWNQTPYVNSLCPGGSVTGCVATAMAQIMKYWSYPATGSGFHSYNHSTYGTISANFGNATYQWSSMPNIVSSSNNAVATLMFHCGVSVDMNYSPSVSGAYVITAQSPVQHCSEYALKTYFGYKNTLSGAQRASYNQTQWISLLKNELDASRPILYAGFGTGGGHAFVCDGYDINNYFHFNWGWGGAYDGYFSINALNPSGTGTGGGSGGYNSGHQVLIGIEPPTSTQTLNLSLFDYVTPSASIIYYGQAFTISTNIKNNGTNTFNGDYCAAVFDNQSNLIDFVEIKTGYTLQGGYSYTNNLVFQNTGLFSMLPGSYYVGIFYRPTGGNWVLVDNSGSYVNLVQMSVTNPNDIELNSAITVTPGNTLIQGQSASANLNIVNDGLATFIGQYQVNLYELDGTFVETINTMNETTGLPSGYTYLSPFLTFSTTAITANPGTYLLAAIHKSSSSSNWELTGSSYFQNPIKVTVQSASLAADQYEINNTVSLSYLLPISFSGNTATKNTSGSNLHNGTDNDFYKINLPYGYNYTISSRIHDSYNSGNGNVYSVDALFSYSTNGTSWSDTYDDVMTGNISLTGGGTVYFHVAPYFAGETGSYLLDMTINRTSTSGIDESEISNLIRIFPNPAKDVIHIDLHEYEGKISQINLVNIQGQQLISISKDNINKYLSIPIYNLAKGIYLLQLQSASGIITKKVIVGN